MKLKETLTVFFAIYIIGLRPYIIGPN